MHIFIPCKYKKDQIKNNREQVETSFSPLHVNGGFLLPSKPMFLSNLPQNLMQPFPHPSYIWNLIKIGHLASEIFKFESVDDDGPLVYYKLTLWAFGSSELKFYVYDLKSIYWVEDGTT